MYLKLGGSEWLKTCKKTKPVNPRLKILNNFSYTKSLILTINCAQIKAG